MDKRIERIEDLLNAQHELLCALLGRVAKLEAKMRQDEDEKVRLDLVASAEWQLCTSSVKTSKALADRIVRYQGSSYVVRLNQQSAMDAYARNMNIRELRKKRLFKTDAWKAYKERMHKDRTNDEVFDLAVQ